MNDAKDGAEVVRVRREFDGEHSKKVYYRAHGALFRATLVRVEDGQAWELDFLDEIEAVPTGDEEATVAHSFDLSTQVAHVPPVVREAVSRPVQVPIEADA